MSDRDPNIITSGLSGHVTEDGVTVDVKIYRLELDHGWALEVVNDKGTSIVWDMLFDSDDEALAAFNLTLEEEGMEAFEDKSNVVPFRLN